MGIKTRRRRRLSILLVVVLVVAGGLAAVIFLRQWSRQRSATQAHEAGIAAYEAEQYPQAVENLKIYLDYAQDDADPQSLYRYAKANLNVPNPKRENLGAAVRALRRVVAEDPSNQKAARELIDLYKLVGANDEMLELSEKLLENDPASVPALSAKALVLARESKPQEALVVAQKALEADPLNYQMHLLSLQLRHDLGEGGQELISTAQALVEQHPEDPRFEMLLGYTYGLLDQPEQSRKWLRSAADRPIEDAQFARTLIQVLDGVRLYDASLKVLRGNAELSSGLFSELARRLFEHERYQKVVEHLDGIGPKAPNDKIQEMALKAMALVRLGRRDEASKLIESLAARPKAPTATLWAKVLRVLLTPDAQSPDVIQACREALATMPGNAYLHAFLGSAYQTVGDRELALAAWARAAELRPAWGAIRMMMARALLESGRSAEALEYAQAALLRQPHSVEAAVAITRARAASLPVHPDDSPEQVLALIDQIQQAAPGEPRTLVLQVALLAQMGRHDAAVQAVQQILDREGATPQSLLLQLANISREYDLAVNDAIYARIEKTMGSTPELAMSKALALAREGMSEEGLKLIDRVRSQSESSDDPQWRLARAAYLDAIDDPAAAGAWVELADAFPQNVRLQRTALHADSVQGDREFTGRVLDRLQQLMGEKSVRYRLERAQWLLGGDAVDASRIGAAADLLRSVIADAPDRVEPRLLLARCLVLLDRVPAAIRELTAANQAISNSPPILLQLARLQQRQRQFSTARSYLDQVIANPATTVEQYRQAASLLARQGEVSLAIRVLEQLRDRNPGDDSDSLLLARLYARTGQADQADAMLQELLKTPTPETISLALGFYSDQNRPQQVQQVLTKLEQMTSIPAATRQAMLASYYAGAGQFDKAAQSYRASVESAPRDAERWRQLIRFHLAVEQVDQAVAAAEQALRHVPKDPVFQFIQGHEAVIRELAADAPMRSVLVALIGGQGMDAPTAAKALTLAGQLAKPGEARSTAHAIEKLASGNPDALGLEILASRAYLRANQPRQAAEIAGRAAQSFPTAVEPAWLHAEALAADEQWVQALGAATEWRERSTGSTRSADLMIAEAKLHLNDPAGALQSLAPYREQALAQPQQHEPVVSRYVRALVSQQRYDQAANVLMPLLPRATNWRVLAMRLASQKVAGPAVAEDWLNQVAAALPDDALDELSLLGQSWWSASQRLDIPAMGDRAWQTLEQVTADPRADARAWYMRGVLAEKRDAPEAAEAAYRTALKHNAELAAALNNLAMLLARRSGDLAEALRLAEQAVAVDSDNVNFLDTLAFVQARAGQYGHAVASMKRAIELDPNNPQWQRNLVKILRQGERTEEADALERKLRAQGVGSL